MKNTDYVVWQSVEDDELAPDAYTSQIDCWSDYNHHPPTNPINSYETTWTKSLDAGVNTFTSYRGLQATKFNTYQIPLDTNIKMIYAYSPWCSMLCNHHRDYGYFDMVLDSTTGQCFLKNTQERTQSVHGWLMWFSWTLIAMAEISVNRYGKQQWRWQQFTHNILGALSFVFTVTGTVLIFANKDWHLSYRQLRHSMYGLFFAVTSVIMMAFGFLGWIKRRTNAEFNTRAMLAFKRIHMYFGYAVCFTVQFAVCSGIIVRVLNTDQSVGNHKAGWLIFLNLSLILVVMVTQEVRHQRFIR